MTPVCHCEWPSVVRETKRITAGPLTGQEYDVTYCRKCGHHWSPEYGSHPEQQ